ncbi:DUF6478 family protein [Primorskyibacter marinus]|uniref:DUF6478 family protein n=1 Tax=Primorskyibacter marinus TaxID=1977320 RepID=UPI000E30849B|nr:DUF6478 family protein [Primorskyibacter marinus]
MAEQNRFLDRLTNRAALRRWARAARRADATDLTELRVQRQHARRLRHHLDKLIQAADSRLALPRIGSTRFPKPNDTDWAYRPELWRGPLRNPGLSCVASNALLGEEVKVFHDCTRSELTLRQLRNTRVADLAPFGLQMDVFGFDGSYLSLAIDLPDSAVKDLRRRHLLRMEAIVELESPLRIFARLNIKHGPNVEQLVMELPLTDKAALVEFDLAYSNLNERRVERLWLDLIFEEPAMNQVILRDLTFSRRPRAEL